MQRFLKKIEKNSEKNLQLTKKCLPLQSQTKRDKVLWSLFLDGYKASWRWRRELPLGNDRLKRKDNAVADKKKRKGSIAQLVQSVCLTSRGSGVRLPLLPPKSDSGNWVAFFCTHSPGPLLPSGCSVEYICRREPPVQTLDLQRGSPNPRFVEQFLNLR